MSFIKEHKIAINSKQQEWLDIALGYVREKGPNKDGTYGFVIRKGDRDIGNHWIDWFMENGFVDAAYAVAPMIRAKGGYQVPCRDPNDLENWMKNNGKDFAFVEMKQHSPHINKTKFPDDMLKRLKKICPNFDESILNIPGDFSEYATNAAVEKLRKMQLARLALQQGWLNGLFEFVRNTGIDPTERQIASIKALSKLNDEVMKNPANASISAAMLDRRRSIEELIFGKVSNTDAAE